jgi:hypothetical protein
LEDVLDGGELGRGEPIVVDRLQIVVSGFGPKLEVGVLERVVQARIEAGFGFGLVGAEVLAFGVGSCGLIVEVAQPEGSDVADGVDV